MVRSYSRHQPAAVFGLIASNTSVRPVLDGDSKTAYVAALEDVLVWNVKSGELKATWHEIGHTSSVTALARNSADKDVFAVGYADGSIRLWRASTNSSSVTFDGHKGSVTALEWDSNGMRLASAGQDASVVLWDTVNEVGLFRLKGHRDGVTDLAFLPRMEVQGNKRSMQSASRFITSVAKDGLVKVWDLDLQHCTETAAPGDGELCSVAAVHVSELPETELEAAQHDSYVIVTGGSEGQVRVWTCQLGHEPEANSDIAGTSSAAGTDRNMIMDVHLESVGTLQHGLTKRVTQVAFEPLSSPRTDIPARPLARRLACLTSDRTLQSFFFRSEADIRKKMARRAKRAKEKRANKGADSLDSPAEDMQRVSLLDCIETEEALRPQDGRFRAFTFGSTISATTGPLVLLLLSNNALDVRALKSKGKQHGEASEAVDSNREAGPIYTLDMAGHRSDIRAVAISHSGELVASACSAGHVKVWNLATGSCLRTMSGGYALSILWTADDSHIVVGCKDGTMRTYELSSGSELDTIPAHDGPLWSLALRPDGAGLVSGSADKSAKFWTFERSEADDEDEEDTADCQSSHVTLVHARTLKMTDDILAVAFSPDGRLLALSLLDSTIKIFFSDTLKFYLSLYGHKLPALTLDISHDSKLIITGSADKNVKIWGLDFGDCHRSLIAHSDSVMAVRFEGGQQGGGLMGGREGVSHRFWSAGKDGLVKYWDGDRFEQIQSLRGHHGEIWALATDQKGTKVVTAGADRSLRLWEKTEEPLFLEEEREKELEAVYQNAGTDRNDDELEIGALAEDGKTAGQASEVTDVAAASQLSKTAAERLIEAIEIADIDVRDQAQPLPPPRSALLLAGLKDGDEQSAARFLFRTVEAIPTTQLTDVLLLLSFSAVTSLLSHLNTWLQKEWSILLSARVLFFLLNTHHAQIVSNGLLRDLLADLRRSLRSSLARQKDLIGFNARALEFVRGQARDRKQADFDPFQADTKAAGIGPAAASSTRPSKRKMAI